MCIVFVIVVAVTMPTTARKRKYTPSAGVLKAKAKKLRKTTTRVSRAPVSSAVRKSRPAPKRRKKGAAVSAAASKSLAVYMNPFSNATQNARIPDGKISESLGVRSQSVTEISANLDFSSDPMEILLYPGSGSGCIVGNLVGPGDRVWNVLGYNDHGKLNITNLSGPGGGTVSSSDPMQKWRVVSQGLKISLINNAETNDGWWEACRITPEKRSTDFSLLCDGNTSDITQASLVPESYLTTLRNRSIVDQRTYCTGLLRNIHKHIFTLKPSGNEHDFNDFPSQLQFNANDAGPALTDGVSRIGNRFFVPSAQVENGLNSWMDWSYDMLYIRIYPNTDATNRSRFMFHLIGNHEVSYPENVRDSKYHQRPEVLPEHVMSTIQKTTRANDAVAISDL